MRKRELTICLVVCALGGCDVGTQSTAEQEDQPSSLEARASAPACDFTEIISPDEFNTTERSGFTSDGRMFLIGTRPGSGGGDPSAIAELVRDASSERYRLVDRVDGALEGTSDGRVGGPPLGDPCLFTGMAVRGSLLYAGCLAPDGRASFMQVDLQQNTVRADYFTTCNLAEPRQPCEPRQIMPNGMAIDDAGRIYTSNMLVHLSGQPLRASPTLTQIVIDEHPAEPQKLAFHHLAWVDADVFTDGLSPNGVQIEGDTLYYAAGPNLNAVPIRPDGSAGPLSVRYRGPLFSYIDDFGVQSGSFTLARTLLPGAVATLRPRVGSKRLYQTGSCLLPNGGAPSSIGYQPDLAPDSTLFVPGTIIVTSFFGGGLYTLPPES